MGEKLKKFKLFVFISSLILIGVIVLLFVLHNKSTIETPKNEVEFTEEQLKKIEDFKKEGLSEEEIEDITKSHGFLLSTEEDIKQYSEDYAVEAYGEFFEYIEDKEFKKAYEKLLPDYKNAEFPTLESFKTYCDKKFLTQEGFREYYSDGEKSFKNNRSTFKLNIKNDDDIYEEFYITTIFEIKGETADYYITFDKFVEQNVIEKSVKVSPNCKLTLTDINRYQNNAIAELKIENNTKYDVAIGSSSNIEEFVNGAKEQSDISLNVKLRNKDYKISTDLIENGSYIIKAGETKEIDLKFLVSSECVLQNLQLDYIMIDKIYNAKIEINK